MTRLTDEVEAPFTVANQLTEPEMVAGSEDETLNEPVVVGGGVVGGGGVGGGGDVVPPEGAGADVVVELEVPLATVDWKLVVAVCPLVEVTGWSPSLRKAAGITPVPQPTSRISSPGTGWRSFPTFRRMRFEA